MQKLCTIKLKIYRYPLFIIYCYFFSLFLQNIFT